MTLNLSDQEIMVIGAALGKMPYEQVAPVIASLQQQINAQTTVNTPAQPAEETNGEG